MAHSVGLQSTRVVGAAVEGREILGPVAASVAVEDNAEAGWIAIIGEVHERRFRRSAFRPGASLDGQVQPRRQPPSFADCACDPTITRGLGHLVCGIGGTGRDSLRPNRRRGDGEAAIANT